MIKLHRISQIPSNCMKRQLSVRATVPKMLISFFRLIGRFGSARTRLNPLSGKILDHDSVSVIVPSFTILVQDFLISCCQVTKLFARGRASPVRLLQEVFVILVLKQTSKSRSFGK